LPPAVPSSTVAPTAMWPFPMLTEFAHGMLSDALVVEFNSCGI
jgi:hypothetical protein